LSSRASVSFDAPPSPAPYPLSLHDALPISQLRLRQSRSSAHARDVAHGSQRGPPQSTSVSSPSRAPLVQEGGAALRMQAPASQTDRKSTRLNSSHVKTSYAVFCLKKKTGRD